MVILTENHTLVPPGDLQGLIDMAVAAERGGANAVMLSDHVCLGPEAGAPGQPANPRDYAAPGNRDLATEWPSPIVMAAAIAAGIPFGGRGRILDDGLTAMSSLHTNTPRPISGWWNL